MMQSSQKTPAIVHDQGKSRQTLKMNKRHKWASSLSLWSAQTCLRFGTGRHVSQSPAVTPPSPPDPRNPKTVPGPPPSRQKTPVIVPHQGKSRQTAKNGQPWFSTSTAQGQSRWRGLRWSSWRAWLAAGRRRRRGSRRRSGWLGRGRLAGRVGQADRR